MYKHALVVGKFAPFHHGHEYLLNVARSNAERLTILVWSNPDFTDMPSQIRAAWIRHAYPEANVFVPENPPDNAAPDEVQRLYVQNWLQANGLQPDVVYSSESYGPGFAERLGCIHEMVDLARQHIPISGAAIRNDIHQLREFLSPYVYAHFIQRVVFMGAESTGKSTLVEHLAKECKTTFVPEFGRSVWEEKKGKLELADYVWIADQHRVLEDKAALNANRYLFIDTNAITTLFFSYYYNKGALPRLHALALDCKSRYDFSFVCDTDVPFHQDGWRDNALWRERLQGLVLYDLDRRNIAYFVLRGDLPTRSRAVVNRLRANT